MRLDYNTLVEVEDYYGSSDFKIEFEKEKITFRFGYWRELYNEEKFYAIFENLGFQVNKWQWEDDDCGWLHSYSIVKK